ncbi:MAG: hypothetical protein H8E66_24740 [Planctomycetes bacterium]|nr:hypothetical protein [Planctomycetota bacterium]
MSTTRVTWLHTNRRALRLGLIVLLPAFAGSLASVSLASGGWVRWSGAAASIPLAYLIFLCGYLMFQPRLSYADEHLHVRLRQGPAIQVPIDVVECFFLGQGPALLPRPFGNRDKLEETSTIVVRLAESAEHWKQFDVKPTWGLWCDGYITIRGTWCEPITNELLKHLNDRLIAAHRELRGQTQRGTKVEQPIHEQEVG